MSNELHIKSLKDAMAKINEGMEVFKEYCTEDCEHCPLFKINVCGYYMEFVPTDAVTDSVLNNFVDLHENRGYFEERMW